MKWTYTHPPVYTWMPPHTQREMESARQEPTQKISADTGMSSCHHQLQMTMYVPFIRHTPRLVQVQPTTIPLVN